MKKKTVVLFLLASMLLNTFCACAETEDIKETEASQNTAETTETAETAAETEPPYYDTKGANYDGSNFGIWNYDNVIANGWAGIPYDLFTDEITGDTLNDAVYNRNLEIQNKLNITIIGTNSTANFAKDIAPLMAAGDTSVDLMFPAQVHVPSLVSQDSVYDILELESFDLSEPWWNQNCNETMTMKGKLFVAASDATYFDKLATTVVFYNKKLMSDHNLGEMYDIVNDGAWTLDKAIELGGYVTNDLNGDSVYDLNDSIGISCQNDGSYYLLHGFGINVCANDEEGNIAFNLKSERAVDVLQSIYTLMGNPQQYFNRQTYSLTLNDAINMFIENRTLFLIRPLQSLFLMRDMDADFGIIPLPKYDEAQTEYYSAVNPITGTIGMLPRTSADPERSAVVLSAMACESHYTVINELYDTVLGQKLTRDAESSVMLDYIFDGAVFDPGMIWNFGDIRNTLLQHIGADVSSMIASVTKVVEKSIEKFNEYLTEEE